MNILIKRKFDQVDYWILSHHCDLVINAIKQPEAYLTFEAELVPQFSWFGLRASSYISYNECFDYERLPFGVIIYSGHSTGYVDGLKLHSDQMKNLIDLISIMNISDEIYIHPDVIKIIDHVLRIYK